MKLMPVLLAALALSNACAAAATTTTRPTSAFYPPKLVESVRANAARSDWGRGLRDQAVKQAEPWMKISDEQLWKLMFGATIPRSWMVFSNGTCPSCGKPVPMYDWQINALDRPWKLRCPHCQELFPKNDFAKFHESGLDEHGVFDPKKADRTLLFNIEHPDAHDPLHTFGVDDGTGYAQGDKRWRFISTYLVYGQWKQAVHLGITRLATAYVLTGDPAYAHKSAILLDRVADVYPTFDFNSQGLLYESVHGNGYVSVWHDATIETREMALAYDAIKPAIADDEKLASFLSEKSEKYQTPIRKHAAADILNNIETRILKDALANQHKIYSNYPQQYLTMAVIDTALAWPANRAQVLALLDPVIEKATAVDGTTGEKGLAGYSSYAAQRLAEFLGYYARMDDQFLPEMTKRHPHLPQMWRFFIDTWCADEKFYPLIGDTGHVAGRFETYAGVSFMKDHALGATGHMSGVLAPSMYTFLWQLYEVTKDPAFAQVLYKANDGKLDGLPYDLSVADPAAFTRELKSVLDAHGDQLKLTSVNKQNWHLAILRSGDGADNRALWLDYDAGGNHGHFDGMNLGFFAKGLDLMPDFGYPPVQFGGWASPRALWYVSTAAHNTVLINGAQQTAAGGKTTLWASGAGFSAIATSAPELYPGIAQKYERTVAMVDVSDKDSYVLDIFRVAGGADHAKFFLSHPGTIETSAELASMQPASDFTHPQMRNFKVARTPKPGWSVTWNIDDTRVRYTDFTADADAYTCEAWAVTGDYNSTEEIWLPRVMVRHRAADAKTRLKTNFVSLIEPYDAKAGPLIKSAQRLPLADATDDSAALKIDLAAGATDILISNGGTALISQPDTQIETDARLALIRTDAAGKPTMISFCNGTTLRVGSLKMESAAPNAFIQLRLNPDATATVLAGNPDQVKSIGLDGKPISFKQ